jgi:alpha-D-xyloside xylohydrolase
MIQILISFVMLAAGLALPTAAPAVERLQDGIRVQTGDGVLALHVKTDSIIRVTFSKTPGFRADDMVVVAPTPGTAPRWSWSSNAQSAVLTTSRLHVTVSLSDGAVTFADASGHTILAEAPGGHRMTPADVQGEHTFHVQQLWKANAGESLYGLGQRQEAS